MAKPIRQRPGAASEVGSTRLQAAVEDPFAGPPAAVSVEQAPAVTAAQTAEPAATKPTRPTSTRPKKVTAPVEPPVPAGAKESISTRMPSAVLAAARDAVMATGGQPGGCRSLADLITQAVEAKVQELQELFNNGAPFPSTSVFRAGRPFGS